MKKIILALGLIMTLLSGCSGFQGTKLYPFPQNNVIVRGNVIFCGGSPFAELKFFDPRFAEASTEVKAAAGLVIYYYDMDKEIWIWPEKGMSIKLDGEEHNKLEDMNRVWSKFSQEHHAYVKGQGPDPQKWPTIYIGGKGPDKEDLIRSVSYAIRISDDGKYVYYKTQGMLFDSSRKYLVEYGLSK